MDLRQGGSLLLVALLLVSLLLVSLLLVSLLLVSLGTNNDGREIEREDGLETGLLIHPRPYHLFSRFECRVWSLGCRVWGLGCRFWGLQLAM